MSEQKNNQYRFAKKIRRNINKELLDVAGGTGRFIRCWIWTVCVTVLMNSAIILLLVLHEGSTMKVCNNVCVIIVSAMILTTILILAGGVLCFKMYCCQMDNRMSAGYSFEKTVSEKETSYEDNLLAARKNFLEEVVSDTLTAFKSTK